MTDDLPECTCVTASGEKRARCWGLPPCLRASAAQARYDARARAADHAREWWATYRTVLPQMWHVNAYDVMGIGANVLARAAHVCAKAAADTAHGPLPKEACG